MWWTGGKKEVAQRVEAARQTLNMSAGDTRPSAPSIGRKENASRGSHSNARARVTETLEILDDDDVVPSKDGAANNKRSAKLTVAVSQVERKFTGSDLADVQWGWLPGHQLAAVRCVFSLSS